MKRSLLLLFILLQCINSFGQPCPPDQLIHRTVQAAETDSNIISEDQHHQIFINPDCVENDRLLIHLVGTFDDPANTTYFPSLAANNGFKVINLKYRNLTPAQNTCGNSSDIDCFDNYRQEIIFGDNVSPDVFVNAANSIMNRIEKLLAYLDATYPAENWGNFLNSSSGINWENVWLSGHSQGGGHAAYIAKQFEVQGVLMFASPNDYSTFFSASANWIMTPGVTAASAHFAFGHFSDEISDFEHQFQTWTDLGMNTDSTNVDLSFCHYNNSNILYTKDESSTGIGANHNSLVIDEFTPQASGTPIFSSVWEYMLRICDISDSNSNIADSELDIKIFPNPTSNLLFAEHEQTIIKIEIYNPTGGLVQTIFPNQNNFQISLNKYNGLLLLRFTIEDSIGVVSKVVCVEK